MTRAEMLRHAEEWIEAWNRGDIEAVLRPFAEDCVFVSPRAAALTGSPRVEGKAALRAYWQTALSRVSSLRFELLEVLCDETAQTMLIFYISHRDGQPLRAAEMLRFSGASQVYGEAFYGAAVD